MHPSRIFDKPIGFYEVGPPPLQVVGTLPGYEQGGAYEGRLSILNAIGDCTVDLLENNLPPGATATVDNSTQEVVIRWPPYSPVVENREILNWNFELGTLEGWRDLRGGSWDVYVYDRFTPGNKDIPYQAPDGNRAARMEGVGRGDHTLESIPYPATPGQPVMAQSLWYQGPSNKDNNNLWTAIVFYGPGGQSLEVRGDRIHDRTNKRRHFSTVNTTTPAWAETKAVRLIAHRRNRRNRLINVDDVVTSGFSYSTGVDNGDDFYLTIRVRDSANRVAYWTGIIPYGSFFLTSQLYGISLRPEFAEVGFSVPEFVHRILPQQFVESSSVSEVSFSVTAFEHVYKELPAQGERATVTFAVPSFVHKVPPGAGVEDVTEVGFSVPVFEHVIPPHASPSEPSEITFTIMEFTHAAT